MGSPGGDRILTASRDGTARVWRVETFDLVAVIEAATRICLYPEFREKNLGDSPEEARGRYLACASAVAEWRPSGVLSRYGGSGRVDSLGARGTQGFQIARNTMAAISDLVDTASLSAIYHF